MIALLCRPRGIILGTLGLGTLISAYAPAQLAPTPGRPPAEATPLEGGLPALPEAIPPAVTPAGAGPMPGLPGLPQRDPRPPQEVAGFVDSLGRNDAAFEVVVGQGRILTTRGDIAGGRAQALIAVGDPSVVEFAVVSPRQIRVTGLRIGVTDLSITTSEDQTYSFEVRVVADLGLLTSRVRSVFPDARIKLTQIRDHVVVEGEARDAAQVANIIRTITAYLESVRSGQVGRTTNQQASPLGPAGLLGAAGATGQPGAVPLRPNSGSTGQPTAGVEAPIPGITSPELNPLGGFSAQVGRPQVINLLRVPTSQQVLLKVRVAELNRTALRQIGANFLGVDPATGAIVGTQIAGPTSATGAIGNPTQLPIPRNRVLGGAAALGATANTTVFGIFQDANFEFTLNALRRNAMLKILAEPNLVAMNGHRAEFQAGGQFPVPVPQVGAAGVAPTVTVQFKDFGVLLGFVPTILDGDVIRLSVAPEVSQIDFTIATTLVAGGTPVPGLNVRRAQTTVELRQGQTLAIAGLLQLQLNGSTSRIPGLGDLPIIGPFFSNTTGERVEKELVVLVTPYLVEPMNPEQVPPGPGDEVKEPNDLELFLLNRIEGRTGRDFRSTTRWDDPFRLVKFLHLEKKYVNGPCGFSD